MTHGRPLVFGDIGEPNDLPVEVAGREEAQQLRYVDRPHHIPPAVHGQPEDDERSPALRFPERFGGGELRGLVHGDVFGGQIAAHELQRSDDEQQRQRDLDRRAMEATLRLAPQPDRVDPEHGEAHARVRSGQHVKA